MLQLNVSQQGGGKRWSGGYTPFLWEVAHLLLLMPMSQHIALGNSTYLQGRLGNEVLILGLCLTPCPMCQICPEYSPYGSSHHYSPLDDSNSCLTGFPASPLAFPWNLCSAQNGSFRNQIFNSPTQNPLMVLEDSPGWNSCYLRPPPFSFTHSSHIWSLAGPQDGRQTLVWGFLLDIPSAWKVPSSNIHMAYFLTSFKSLLNITSHRGLPWLPYLKLQAPFS